MKEFFGERRRPLPTFGGKVRHIEIDPFYWYWCKFHMLAKKFPIHTTFPMTSFESVLQGSARSLLSLFVMMSPEGSRFPQERKESCKALLYPVPVKQIQDADQEEPRQFVIKLKHSCWYSEDQIRQQAVLSEYLHLGIEDRCSGS